MSCNLGVSSPDVKDAVKRDRCDWLAAIFNLLIDQPEGRNHIQQANEDPEDQLVDAQHYQGTMEHFRLSQAGRYTKYIELGALKLFSLFTCELPVPG